MVRDDLCVFPIFTHCFLSIKLFLQNRTRYMKLFPPLRGPFPGTVLMAYDHQSSLDFCHLTTVVKSGKLDKHCRRFSGPQIANFVATKSQSLAICVPIIVIIFSPCAFIYSFLSFCIHIVPQCWGVPTAVMCGMWGGGEGVIVHRVFILSPFSVPKISMLIDKQVAYSPYYTIWLMMEDNPPRNITHTPFMMATWPCSHAIYIPRAHSAISTTL